MRVQSGCPLRRQGLIEPIRRKGCVLQGVPDVQGSLVAVHVYGPGASRGSKVWYEQLDLEGAHSKEIQAYRSVVGNLTASNVYALDALRLDRV